MTDDLPRRVGTLTWREESWVAEVAAEREFVADGRLPGAWRVGHGEWILLERVFAQLCWAVIMAAACSRASG